MNVGVTCFNDKYICIMRAYVIMSCVAFNGVYL